MIFDDRSNMTRPDHPHSENENEFQWPNIYSKMSGSDDTPIQDVTNVELNPICRCPLNESCNILRWPLVKSIRT